MPKQYEAMRDRFVKEGLSLPAAKAKAARIYNSQHPDKPVGPHYDKGKKRKSSPFKKRRKDR